MSDFIVIHGARQHNLKNIHLELPRNKLIVVTGLSGSGKSSLAFDTIYAEGQRRYVESLSAYARQFLEQMQKPDVDYIEGLSPAISIEQRSAGSNPRSTVGTQTELYDYLRLLFARIGTPYCYKCGKKISHQAAQEIINKVALLPAGTKVMILSPQVRGRKGEYKNLFQDLRKAGFARVRIDGRIYDLDEEINIDKKRSHNIEVVVDRITLGSETKKRLADSIETALKFSKGLVIINREDVTAQDTLYSELFACAECGTSYSEIEPRIFSFNSPYGACPQCNGLGTKMEIDPDLVMPDKNKSITGGAIEPWKKGGLGYLLYYRALLKELAAELNFSLDTPFKQLSWDIQKKILHGSDTIIWGKPFKGLIPYLEKLFCETDSDYLKEEINRFMSTLDCPLCHGKRLKLESLYIKIEERSIADIAGMSIVENRDFFRKLKLSDTQKSIVHQVLKEILRRLDFMLNVGLDYLTLDRASSSLSGGEAQRIRLATQIGAGLVGVLYILDEPSIGLHQRDNVKLLSTLRALRDMGNTLVVVEHDEATIRSADYIVDLGPGAGKHGGKIVCCGTPRETLKCKNSLTSQYLRGELEIEVPEKRRPYRGAKSIEIKGASEHNLKNIDVKIPLGLFSCVTGVSGSGKSTLIDEILYRSLAQKLYHSKERPGKYKAIKGTDFIDKVIVIDQSPIGRTPRSNPATYTGVFNYIRELFSMLPEARMRGYRPGRFSFNVKGGRCEACQGDGVKKIEMHFLPDVYVICEVCKGARFNEQTLEIKYKGKSIRECLEMTVEEAISLFENIPRIKNKLVTLNEVGLSYIQLGQPVTTLSGGEAQRIKLSAELSRKSTGATFYILDEPTTGLHFHDVAKLLAVLFKLRAPGNTLVIIE
ncbi:MAG: excinuclease ABC subunit UvrA, partial [Candidatus Omnitrophica bacterium]|nr:excinuclease ABC subunit UvrA [Candidatus Omnitrophota bacterium]